MYLQECTIRNVKCFEEIRLDFRNPDGSLRLWNVIIGENGTGKTTLLKAIAVALLGEKAAGVLLPRPRGWVRSGREVGTIAATIVQGNVDVETGWGQATDRQGEPIDVVFDILEHNGDAFGDNGPTIKEKQGPDAERLEYPRSPQAHGWFAAGYGSFRRLTGGSEQTAQIADLGAREARFVTLFREDASLNSSVEWLLEVDHTSRDETFPEDQKKAKLLKELFFDICNNYILTEEVKLIDINSRGILFDTPYASRVQIADLSDGYRAVLAMVLDLLRQLSASYPLFLQLPDWRDHINGVVLIDEIDTHLHPVWQRKIGHTLKSCFPRMQFIVTTHSPFIPQTADDHGLYVLRRAEATNTVTVDQDEVSVRGWRADQILTSDLFGLPTTRDVETEALLQRYDALLARQVQGVLSEQETQELGAVKEQLGTLLPVPGDTPAQRDLHQRMQAYIARTLSARNGQ